MFVGWQVAKEWRVGGFDRVVGLGKGAEGGEWSGGGENGVRTSEWGGGLNRKIKTGCDGHLFRMHS